jgi:hypothetical protein
LERLLPGAGVLDIIGAYNYGKRREYLERNEYNPFGVKGDVDKRWVEKLLHGEKGLKGM